MKKLTLGISRGSHGFGLSLVYRGSDLFQVHHTGVFVSKLIPGGPAQRSGVQKNDKVIKINNKLVKNVDEAVTLISKAGHHITLEIERGDDQKAEKLRKLDSARNFNIGYTASRSHSPEPEISIEEEWEILKYKKDLADKHLKHSQLGKDEANADKADNELQQVRYADKEEHIGDKLGDNGFNVKLRRQSYLLSQLGEQENLETHLENKSEDKRKRRQQKEISELISSFKSFQDSETEQIVINEPIWQTSKSLDRKLYKRYQILPSQSNRSFSRGPSVSSHDINQDAKLSRKDEKDHLQRLNNRLAGYIDKVRQLQTENMKMSKKVTKLEEHQKKEVSTVTALYEQEKKDMETAIAELTEEYNELKNYTEEIKSENKNMKLKKERIIETDNLYLNSLQQLQSDKDILSKQNLLLENGNKKRKNELDDSLVKIATLSQKKEEIEWQIKETQKDIDNMYNMSNELRGERKDKLNALQHEINEAKSLNEREVDKLGCELKKEYEDRLSKALSSLREVYEKKMLSDKTEFENKYEKKLMKLKMLFSKERSKNVSDLEDLQENARKIEAFILKTDNLVKDNDIKGNKIRNMLENIEEEKSAQNEQVYLYLNSFCETPI